MVVFTEFIHPDRQDAKERYWRAEYYSDNQRERNFPIGIGYGVHIPEPCNVAQLNFIVVPDQWRRTGIASGIIEECLKKWPNLHFTSGMDKRGESLIKKMSKRRRLSD